MQMSFKLEMAAESVTCRRRQEGGNENKIKNGTSPEETRNCNPFCIHCDECKTFRGEANPLCKNKGRGEVEVERKGQRKVWKKKLQMQQQDNLKNMQ